jgi:hypothetical protein
MDMRERVRVIIAEAQHPEFHRTFLASSRQAAMPDPTWQELYNAAIVEFDLTRLPERVEDACHAIHQYRVQKRHTISAAERNELDEALRVLFKLMERAA